MKTFLLDRLHRRLLPIYIAAFLQNVVFWYATEKVFMTSIGFTSATIGLMVIIMSVSILLFETPSGILADRWSRKKVAIIGAFALGLCAIILGESNSVPIFIFGTLFWGAYSALYSGTYESMLYDTVQEEHQNSDRFQHILGTVRMIEGLAFFVGAIVGGLIASSIGLRETYYYSVPLIVLSIIVISRFQEPLLHKAEGPDPIISHIAKTFSAILRRRFLVPALIASVGFAAVATTVFELSQLWFIELNTPLVWFGVIGAFLYATWGFGGLISTQIRIDKSAKYVCIIAILSYTAMIVSRSSLITFLAQFLASAALVALGVLLLRYLHDNIPTKLRAGSASLVGTLTRITIIPLTYAFSTIAHSVNIFAASSILLLITILASVAFVGIRSAPSVKTTIAG